MSRSLDRLHQSFIRKKSWEYDINNIDLPKIHRETNINQFIYDCEKQEELEISSRDGVIRYLEKANKLVKLINELRLDQRSNSERSPEWYTESYYRIQSAINLRVSTVMLHFINSLELLAPDLVTYFAKDWKEGKNTYSRQFNYHLDAMRLDMELVAKFRTSHLSTFQNISVEVPISK